MTNAAMPKVNRSGSSTPDRERREFLVRCLALAPLPAAAAATPAAQHPASVPRPAQVESAARIAVAAGQLPIVLRRVRVDTAITGRAAKTRVELDLLNPNRRVLEGELHLPLQPGQSVTGFALDIDGELRPAVPVERAKGRQVFEDITRVRVDPALLEATAAHNYRLRVYPLPPQGTRRVVMEITEWLQPTSGDRLAWRLPLRFEQPIDQLEVAVGIQGVSAAGVEASLGAARLPASAQADDMTRVDLRRENYRGSDALVLTLPGRLPAGGVTSTETWRDRDYFYAEVPLAPRILARPRPQRVALLWDASGSGAGRDRAREFALLDAAFTAWRATSVDLVVVRDVAETVVRFEIAAGDWSSLRSRLQAEPFDGATRLEAFAVPDGADLALLFSDGQGTYGAGPIPASTVPVYAFGSGPGTDAGRLRLLAESSGGRYVDLALTSVERALQMLRERPTRVTALRGAGADQLVLASALPEQERIAIAGRLQAPDALVEVQLVDADGSRRVLPVRVRASGQRQRQGGVAVSVAAQRWAAMTLAPLEADAERHRAAIERIGREFGLVTSQTSLIVLDSVADYVRHEIEPPASLLAAWREQTAAGTARAQADLSSHLDRVAARHAERVRWWERDFPKDELPARKPAPHTQSQASGGAARVPPPASLAAPPPPTPMAPAPALMPGPAQAEADAARAYAERQRQEHRRQLQSGVTAGRVAPGGAVPQGPHFAGIARPQERPEGQAPSAMGGTEPLQGAAGIRIAPWVPDSPAMRRLRNTTDAERYATYLDERPSHVASTGFFLDVAELFLERGQTALGLRVLSNLAEMQLGNRHLLRILAYRLLQAGQVETAVPLLEQVARLAPDEPHSLRDLGLAHAAAGRLQRAVDLLWQVISRRWDQRFPDIDMTALTELNAIVARARATGATVPDTRAVDARLQRNLPLALRVVLAWDSDNTDIDLHVIDPNGERCDYKRPLSYQGGRMSADFTSGFGPEEFALRDAKPGTYTVQAHFFGHTQQAISSHTTLMVKLTTGFGTAHQQERDLVVRLSGQSRMLTLGSFEVGPGKGLR